MQAGMLPEGVGGVMVPMDEKQRVTSGRALWRRREAPTRFVVVSRKMAQ